MNQIPTLGPIYSEITQWISFAITKRTNKELKKDM